MFIYPANNLGLEDSALKIISKGSSKVTQILCQESLDLATCINHWEQYLCNVDFIIVHLIPFTILLLSI